MIIQIKNCFGQFYYDKTMKRIVFLILAFAQFDISAQSQSAMMYDLFTAWEGAINILNYDSFSKSISFYGLFSDPYDTINDSLHYRQLYTCSIDSQGNIIKTKVFGKNGINYGVFGNKLLTTDNSRLAFLFRKDTSGNMNYFLAPLTLNGDTLLNRPIQNPTLFYDAGYPEIKDNRILIGGKTKPIVTSPLYVAWIDTNGNLLQYKTIVPTKYNNYGFSQFDIMANGNIFFGGVFNVDAANPYIYSRSWYGLIDALGNIIWDKVCDTPFFFSTLAVFPCHNEDAYYVNGCFSSYDKPGYAFINRINIVNGDIIWSKKYLIYDYFIQSGIQVSKPLFHNGFIYVLGNYSVPVDSFNNIDYAALLKIDMEGNLVWKRLYKNWTHNNNLYSISFLPDGFLLCGDATDTAHLKGNSDAWIIKTDTNGCIEPGCEKYDGIVQLTVRDKYFQVYPNPADNYITISFGDSHVIPKKVTIFNLKGERIEEFKDLTTASSSSLLKLPIAEYQSGFYFIQIEVEDGSKFYTKFIIK